MTTVIKIIAIIAVIFVMSIFIAIGIPAFIPGVIGFFVVSAIWKYKPRKIEENKYELDKKDEI